MTPNEIRRENNLPRLENGDKAFVQVNTQTLDRAVADPVIDKIPSCPTVLWLMKKRIDYG